MKKILIFILLFSNFIVTFSYYKCSGSISEDIDAYEKLLLKRRSSYDKLMLESYIKKDLDTFENSGKNSLKILEEEKEIFEHILKNHKEENFINPELQKKVLEILELIHQEQEQYRNILSLILDS